MALDCGSGRDRFPRASQPHPSRSMPRARGCHRGADAAAAEPAPASGPALGAQSPRSDSLVLVAKESSSTVPEFASSSFLSFVFVILWALRKGRCGRSRCVPRNVNSRKVCPPGACADGRHQGRHSLEVPRALRATVAAGGWGRCVTGRRGQETGPQIGLGLGSVACRFLFWTNLLETKRVDFVLTGPASSLLGHVPQCHLCEREARAGLA